jgi:UDP-glucose 4-epimerase
MPSADADRPAVAVVGARGFIGRAIVAALRSEGVPTVSRGSDSPAVQDGRLHPSVAAASTVVVVSGRSNPALAEQQRETADAELAEAQELFDLLGAVPRPDDRPQRVLLASSGGAVYDITHEPPFSESSPTARSSAYAALKLDIEDCLLAGASPTSQRSVLRLSNVYGPGQRLGTGQGVVGHWFRALLDGDPIRLFGDPETIRDYVYVTDVADAFVAAHRADPSPPPIVNVGSGRPTSLRELLGVLLAAAGRPEHPVHITEDRPFDRRHTWLDVRTADRTLGWRPTTSLEQGLAATWQQALLEQVTPAVDGGR